MTLRKLKPFKTLMTYQRRYSKVVKSMALKVDGMDLELISANY